LKFDACFLFLNTTVILIIPFYNKSLKMSMSLEARKLNIMEYLAEVEDEAVLLQIENLLQPKVDFWEELSATEKASIHKGIEQLEAGQRIGYETFIAKYRKTEA
jgi:hypothetical protein